MNNDNTTGMENKTLRQSVSAFSSAGKPAALFCELPELAGMDNNIWREALAVSQVISYPAGTRLIECGDSADRFMIVLQGSVKVYDTAENGREICLYRVCGGQVCVLTLTRLLLRSNRGAQAVAEKDVRLLAMPPEYFNRLLTESEAFRHYLMTSMAHCITEIIQLISQISFDHLEQRLAALICKLANRATPDRLRCTHQAIANELGTTREVISRLLKDFEHAGHIKLNRGSIEVRNIGGLEILCRQAIN